MSTSPEAKQDRCPKCGATHYPNSLGREYCWHAAGAVWKEAKQAAAAIARSRGESVVLPNELDQVLIQQAIDTATAKSETRCGELREELKAMRSFVKSMGKQPSAPTPDVEKIVLKPPVLSLQEWRDKASRDGTSGEMVYDILRDWERALAQVEESLRRPPGIEE